MKSLHFAVLLAAFLTLAFPIIVETTSWRSVGRFCHFLSSNLDNASSWKLG